LQKQTEETEIWIAPGLVAFVCFCKWKGVESKNPVARWVDRFESVSFCNLFCFRVVCVFRGSNGFFQSSKLETGIFPIWNFGIFD